MKDERVVLELKNISKNFGGVKALQKCSFYVKEGLITGLIGPNGAGKTTAFNIISGFSKPDNGKVMFNGREITGEKPHIISGKGVSRTFQMTRLFDNMTIEENMLLALEHSGENFWKALNSKRHCTPKQKKELKKVLDEVGLDKDINIFASDLSYGQKRLLELARALFKNHNILLLDEPTAGVNPKLREKLKVILRNLRKKGVTILLIEHDMEFVMDLSDEIIVLDRGTKLTADVPSVVKKDPQVLEAYLGE